MQKYGYVYITVNTINGKWYIGQHSSSTFDTKYKGSGKLIKQALNKYGKENFTVDIIEWCDTAEDLTLREIYWIDYFDATKHKDSYNILPGGPGVKLFGEANPMYGKQHTEATKAKISKKLTGLMAGEKNPMYGVHLEVSAETRKKLSESHRGLQVGEKNPMYGKPAVNRGKHHTEATKAKISQSKLGKTPNVSEETKARLSKQRSIRMTGAGNPQFGRRGELSVNYGRHPTEETRKKIGMASKGRHVGINNPSSTPIYDLNSDKVFGCIREVAEFFNLTFGGARYRINTCKPIEFNGHIYVLTRHKKEAIPE